MKGILNVMIGPAGVGKSTWIKEHVQDGDVVVSRDKIRFYLLEHSKSNNPTYFEYENKVFAEYIAVLKTMLLKGNNVYADATHLTKKSRDRLKKFLNSCYDKINYIVFDVPVEYAISNDLKRKGTLHSYVGEPIIKDMYRRYQKPNRETEDFDKLILVHLPNYKE